MGTLNVNGNLTLAPGSTFAADISSAGVDRVNVTGATNLGGSLVPSGSSFKAGTYTLVNATGRWVS